MYSNCIGMRFALLEAKLVIAKALHVVEFQKCEKTEVSDNAFRIVVLSSI
jgi:cytochrome P450